MERATLEDSHRWELEPKEVELGRKLGKGAFGTVYKGTLRGKEVAVKKLHVQQFEDDALEDFRAEVEIMRYIIFDSYIKEQQIISFTQMKIINYNNQQKKK